MKKLTYDSKKVEKNCYYNHFGIIFAEEKTQKYMTKENFVNRNLERNNYLTDFAKKEALKNYDLNINFFNSLNNNEFNDALKEVLNTYAFIDVKDLNAIKGKKGIYILVLDEYKQIYIGQTIRDLRERIIRHFKIEIPFQRVPFIKKDTLPIDAFKPLDTTRIFVMFINDQKTMDEFESNLIKKCPNKFLLNKTIGGKANSYFDVAIRLSTGRIQKDI